MLKVTAVVLGCEAIPALAFGVNYGWRVGGVVFLVMAAILLPAVSVIDVLDGNRRPLSIGGYALVIALFYTALGVLFGSKVVIIATGSLLMTLFVNSFELFYRVSEFFARRRERREALEYMKRALASSLRSDQEGRSEHSRRDFE